LGQHGGVDKAHLNFMSLVSLSSCFRRLLRPRLAPRPVSHVQYKYINFRQDRGQYQVHIPGKLSTCFGTKQEAITATCQAAGETRQSLVLAKSLARDRKRHLFSALWKVFSRSSKGKKVVCLPIDFSAAILAAKILAAKKCLITARFQTRVFDRILTKILAWNLGGVPKWCLRRAAPNRYTPSNRYAYRFQKSARPCPCPPLLKNTGTLINDMVTAPAAVLNGWLVARTQYPTIPNMRC